MPPDRVFSFSNGDRWLQQAAAVAGISCHPALRAGWHWTQSGFRLQRAACEQRVLRRLDQLLKQLSADGLYDTSAARQLAGASSLEALQALPVLTRRGLQELYPRLEALHSGRRGVRLDFTSGSTGEPVRFYLPANRAWHFGMMLAMLELLGWRPGLPRICLWGPSHHPGWNRPSRLVRQLHLLADVSCLAPGPAQFTQLLVLIRANAPCALYGYTSGLAACARWMLERGRLLPPGQVAAAWNSAEMLDRRTREEFQAAFTLPLRDMYGTREVPALAAECACGSMHINPRYIVEAADASGAQLPAGQSGCLLVTDLFCSTTPFIRYAIGDLGAVEWRECACSRRGQVLSRLEGRVSELIRLPGGTQVNSMELNPLVLEQPKIRQYLAVRLAAHRFELRYVGEELTPAEAASFVDACTSKLRGASVGLRRVEQLPRSSGGKLIRYIDACQR